ncbi:MAG TPA: hypothetical protein VFM96_05715 [Gaiellaceae bacterium]|nr:hypothetical protein [Gaiellaceae bacterium]
MTRTLWPPAALCMAAIVAVITAGCGGTPSSSGTSTAAASTASNTTTTAHTTRHTSSLTAREKAVKFSECLRANGVSDFPDPNASGEFPSYGVSVTAAMWTKAVAACKSLQPPGSLNAHLTSTQFSAALKFARCVRGHGVPDFPDPVNGQPLIDTNRIPSANKPGGMTILNAATHTCGHLLGQQTGGQ